MWPGEAWWSGGAASSAKCIFSPVEEVERYLLYSCEGLIDGKQLIGEVFIKKNKTVARLAKYFCVDFHSAEAKFGVWLSQLYWQSFDKFDSLDKGGRSHRHAS